MIFALYILTIAVSLLAKQWKLVIVTTIGSMIIWAITLGLSEILWYYMKELFGIDNDESKQESYSSFHEQPLSLKLANNAFSRFWGNANPAEKDTQPNNSDIAKWVIEQSGGKITQTMADKIAQIIRPEWAATGRKPEK